MTRKSREGRGRGETATILYELYIQMTRIMVHVKL